MLEIEPNAAQHRASAYTLILVAVFTTVVLAIVWAVPLDGPLLLTIVVAYFVFNGGYVYSVVKGQLQTRGSKIGLNAIGLNFAAMLLSDFQTLWTVLSAASIATAVWGASVLMSEAEKLA